LREGTSWLTVPDNLNILVVSRRSVLWVVFNDWGGLYGRERYSVKLSFMLIGVVSSFDVFVV
jgi:hypothetical protein